MVQIVLVGGPADGHTVVLPELRDFYNVVPYFRPVPGGHLFNEGDAVPDPEVLRYTLAIRGGWPSRDDTGRYRYVLDGSGVS